MKSIYQFFLKIALPAIMVMITTNSCHKEVFEEPQDPFENERLHTDYVEIRFGGEGENGYFLKTNRENVDTTENKNLRIRGTLFYDNPVYGPTKVTSGDFLFFKAGEEKMLGNTYHHSIYGDLPVNKGNFTLYNKGAKATEYGAFSGYSEFNIPKVGFIQALDIPLMDGSPIGYVKGSTLEGWPVNADKYYFYFDYTKLGALGAAAVNIGKSKIMLDKLAIDPMDPYLYMHANLDIPKCPVQDAGFAMSLQGNIPFVIGENLKFGNVREFDNGNFLVEGTVDLTAVIGIPVSVAGQVVYAFPINNSLEIAKFFDVGDLYFFMGATGQVIFPVDIVPFFDVELILGEAAMSAVVENPTDFELSFVGISEQPQLSPREFIENLSGQDVDFLKWFELPVEKRYTIWGTVGSSPDNWEFGMQQLIAVKVAGTEIADMNMLMEINTEHLYLEGAMQLALFGEAKMIGEVTTTGRLYMGAFVEAHPPKLEAGPLSLEVDFDAMIELYINDVDNWGFSTKGNFSGEVCCEIPPWGGPFSYDACVGVEVGYEVTIESDGTFVICAEIGVDGFGFEVCIADFDKSKKPTMTYKEIDFKQVPKNQRYYSETFRQLYPDQFDKDGNHVDCD